MCIIAAWSVFLATKGWLGLALFAKVGFKPLPNLMSLERTILVIDTGVTVQVFNQIEAGTPKKSEHL